jgi:hypothetical protein
MTITRMMTEEITLTDSSLDYGDYETLRLQLIAKRRASTTWVGYGPHGPTEANILQAQCYSFCEAFVEKFSHLTMVKGWYVAAEHNYTEHWWLIEKDGTVVDPTKGQFSIQTGEYVSHGSKRAKELELFAKIGRCPNCGGDIYEGDEDFGGVCSDECAASYSEYLTTEMRR